MLLKDFLRRHFLEVLVDVGDEVVDLEVAGGRARVQLPLPVGTNLRVLLKGPPHRCRGQLLLIDARLPGQHGNDRVGIEAERRLGNEGKLPFEGRARLVFRQ